MFFELFENIVFFSNSFYFTVLRFSDLRFFFFKYLF